MLAIRLQRTGRSGHAQYRMVVQDSRRTPTSGNIVTSLGSYNPHAKTLIIDKEKASTFLNNGAQPSPRVAVLLATQGIEMPSWVKTQTKKERTTKRPDQLRSNKPAVEVAPVQEVAEVVEPTSEAKTAPATDTAPPEEVVGPNDELTDTTDESADEEKPAKA